MVLGMMKQLFVVMLFSAVSNAQILIFNPPTLNISDAMAYSTFTVALSKAPAGNAIVNFQTNGISLSVCSLTFNATNFGNPQVIQVLPNPTLSKSTGVTTLAVNASICAYGSAFDLTSQTYTVTHTFQPGGTCTIHEDPHFQPFTGPNYDFQGAGTYYATKSNLLEIQIHTYPYTPTTTIADGIGIRFGNSAVMFNTGHSNGNFTWSKLTDTLRTDEISISNLTTAALQAYQVNLGDGSSVHIELHMAAGLYYLNQVITAASYSAYPDMGGLCNMNGLKGQYLSSNNNDGTDPIAFGNSWVVPAANDMFVTGSCIIPKDIKVPDSYITQKQCALPPMCPAPPPITTTTTVVSTSTVISSSTTTVVRTSTVTTSVEPTSVTLSTPTPTPTFPCLDLNKIPQATISVLPTSVTTTTTPSTLTSGASPSSTPTISQQQAKDYCNNQIPPSACDNIINRDYYLSTCAFDYVQTGDSSFAQTALSAYKQQCTVYTNYMVNSPHSNVRDNALTIQTQCNLHVAPPPPSSPSTNVEPTSTSLPNQPTYAPPPPSSYGSSSASSSSSTLMTTTASASSSTTPSSSSTSSPAVVASAHASSAERQSILSSGMLTVVCLFSSMLVMINM